jgi:hypothetical protein
MKRRTQAIIYTILADDKPVAALEATGIEARELLKERCFLTELSGLKVDGEPIYKRNDGANQQQQRKHDVEVQPHADGVGGDEIP